MYVAHDSCLSELCKLVLRKFPLGAARVLSSVLQSSSLARALFTPRKFGFVPRVPRLEGPENVELAAPFLATFAPKLLSNYARICKSRFTLSRFVGVSDRLACFDYAVPCNAYIEGPSWFI